MAAEFFKAWRNGGARAGDALCASNVLLFS